MSVMPTLDWVNDPVTKLRAGYAAERASISHFSADTVEIDEVSFASGTGLCFTPQELHDGADILYFHGGGYIFGSATTHRGLANQIAMTLDARTVIPNYRLAPENVFPAAVDDAFACYEGLLQTGMDSKDIIVAGDSAGGGLTMALLLKLKDKNQPMPAASILLSPWLDLTCSGESLDAHAEDEDMLSSKMIRLAPAHYHGDTPPDHPYVSPLFGVLKGLPPILVQVGSKEALHSDSTRFVEKAKAAGVRVELQEFYKQPHVFQIFFSFVPEARTAIKNMGIFVKKL